MVNKKILNLGMEIINKGNINDKYGTGKLAVNLIKCVKT